MVTGVSDEACCVPTCSKTTCPTGFKILEGKIRRAAVQHGMVRFSRVAEEGIAKYGMVWYCSLWYGYPRTRPENVNKAAAAVAARPII